MHLFLNCLHLSFKNKVTKQETQAQEHGTNIQLHMTFRNKECCQDAPYFWKHLYLITSIHCNQSSPLFTLSSPSVTTV